jgi:hypothetical protein
VRVLLPLGVKSRNFKLAALGIATAIVIGAMGLAWLIQGGAATFVSHSEAENGVRTSLATVVSDSAASGGQAVRFAPSSTENEFSFAAIPDTQQEVIYETKLPQFLVTGTNIYMNQYFNQRMQWLADNKARVNLKYVWQVGDLQNWDTDTHDQYVRASNGLKILERAGIPFALANGNHDNLATGVGGSARDPARTKEYFRNVDTWNTFYPVSRFPGMKTLCGEFAQFDSRLMAAFPPGMASTDINHPQYVKNQCARSNSSVNAYNTFTAGGLKWVIINYEMWPRQVVQEWMKTVLERHSDHNAILITHYHIDYGGGLSTGTEYGSPQGSPRAVYDRVIKQFSNIKFVSSGHVSQNAYCSSATGTASSLIHNYLNDRLPGQDTPNYFRLIKINVSARTITSEHIMPNPAEAARTPGNPTTCNETNVTWAR